LDDISVFGRQLVSKVAELFRNYNSNTQISHGGAIPFEKCVKSVITKFEEIDKEGNEKKKKKKN
jgi:hypothetical protein